MDAQYDPLEVPKGGRRQPPVNPYANIREGEPQYVYPPVNASGAAVSWYAGKTGRTSGYGGGGGGYGTGTTPTTY